MHPYFLYVFEITLVTTQAVVRILIPAKKYMKGCENVVRILC